MPLCVAALALLALLLALPRSGSAQTRPTPCDPPTDAICQATIGIAVFISPEGSTATGSTANQSIDITVQWCGPQPFTAGTDTVTLDSIRQSFVFTSKASAPIDGYSCRYYAESTGTVSIPGDGRPHEVEAKIHDARDSVGDWVERYTYTYQAPPSYGLTVSPQTSTARHPGGTAAGETFTLANTGNVADSFAVAVTCSGAVSGCGTPPKVTVGANASASVTVPYRLAASGSGTISLSASSIHGASGSGSYTVTATAGAGPLGAAGDAGDQTTLERDLCVKLPAGNGGVYECGDLRTAFALPATRVLNQPRAPTLLYNSAQAAPSPLVAATLTPSSNLTNVVATVRLSTGQTYSTTYDLRNSPWDPIPVWPEGSRRRVAVVWDGRSFATGVYDYTFVLKGDIVGGATGVTLDSVPGRIAIVNRGASAFGRGWWLGGVEQLVAVTAGKLWVGGDGSTRLYAPTGDGVHWAAPALDRPDTLTLDTIVVSGVTQQVYVRTLPGRARVIFDLSGHHIQTRNALGHITGFEWSGDQLQHVRLPRIPGVFDTGMTYDFEYANESGTRLSRVLAPGVSAARVVTFVTDGMGNPTQVTEPDGNSVQYGYAGLMSSRTDRRGTTTRFSYSGGRMTQADQPLTPGGPDDGTIQLGDPPSAVEAHYYYHAEEGAGVASVGPEPGPVGADPVIATVFTDPNGAQTTFWVNRYGAPDSVQDALGHRTRVVHGDPRWPALATSMVAPNGRELTATYDTRGHVVSTTDWSTTRAGAYATTSYAWDDYWDKPTRITQPEGETVTTTYDAYGRPSAIQPGPRASRQTTFTYRPVTDTSAPGLVASVTSPLVSAETYAYDARGNESSVTDPAGLVTTTMSDVIGRVASVTSPTGAQKRLTYDAADQVVEEESYGAPRTVHPLRGDTTYAEEHLWVHTYRNPEGQPDSVARWQSPDVNGIGRIVTGYVYDVAGRKVLEIAPDSTPATLADNPRDSTAYDLAGRMTGVVTRRGYTITMDYDSLGRLVRRVTPAATAPGYSTGFSNLKPQYTFFPYFGEDTGGGFTLGVQSAATSVTIPADTATFAYDVMGNLMEADNRDAHVTRTWNQSGTLTSETQRIRPYVGSDWTKHVYTLGYTYDLDGRRTKLIHPANLSPRAPLSDSTAYTYEPETGALAGVTGVRGYTFSYNDAGQLTQLNRGGDVVESFNFDLAGRLSHRTEVAGGITVHDDYTNYDFSTGEVTSVTTLRESVTQARRGLGALAYVTAYNNDKGTRTAEYYGTDPLTNQVYNRIDTYAADQPATSNGTVQEDPVFAYEAHTGRLLSTASSGAPLSPHEHSWYDVAGNQWFRGSMKPVNTPYSGYFVGGGSGTAVGADLRDESAYWYGADDRLYVADRRACLYFNTTNNPATTLTCDPQRPPSYENRSAFEEYRYDALGRRVLVRTRSEYACNQYCLNTLRREVWDGDQLLYEISAPGGSSETAARMEADTGLAVPFFLNAEHTAISGFFPYGRVMYEHGGGLDAPLGVVRMEFSDELHDAQVVVPLADWRGNYDRGYTYGSCYAYGSNGIFLAPPIDGTPTTADSTRYPPGDGTYGGTQYHCVDVDWPGSYTYSALQYRRGYAGPDDWMGSLIFGSRDASGLYNRRNRYYDADKGRFTQEDPAGLDGGINVYGYANGDALTYADPFGLRPLTASERQQLGDICDQIDCSRVRVHDGHDDRWTNKLREEVTGPENRSVTYGYDIFIADGDVGDMSALAHEMTHVWQYTRMGGARYYGTGIHEQAVYEAFKKTHGAHGRDPYRLPNLGTNVLGFDDFGMEQQAQIVENCFKEQMDFCVLSRFNKRPPAP